MTITKRFQEEVARKLTLLFDRTFENIKQNQEWEVINNIGFQELDRIQMIQNDDIRLLFKIESQINYELDNITGRFRVDENKPRYRKTLECISEPKSQYFSNDSPDVPLDHENGEEIYSPIVDIGIAPSVYTRRINSSRSLGVYPLSSGEFLFQRLSSLSIVTRLNNNFKRYSEQNYQTINLNFRPRGINFKPLYLFAIEIENQPDLKHMMGDIVNSVMLAKYPILVVPNDKLGKSLEILMLLSKISNLKSVNFFDTFSEVAILTRGQFREAVNDVLSVIGESLGVEEF